MDRLREYRFQDRYAELWGIVYLNIALLFILLIRMPVASLDLHEVTLAVQIAILTVYLRRRNTDKKVFIAIATIYTVLTVYETTTWMYSLDGIMHGMSGKGAIFGYLFQSPPYFYPVIRLGTILIFAPLLYMLVRGEWTADEELPTGKVISRKS